MIRPWPYVAAGIFLAALAAGIVVGLEVAAFTVAIEGMNLQGLLFVSAFSALTAAAVFLIGLIWPGALIWLWLHGIGQRSWLVAGLAGAVSAALAGVALTVSEAGLYALLTAPALALPGAAAGLTLRWVAYKPVRPLRSLPPVPPS